MLRYSSHINLQDHDSFSVNISWHCFFFHRENKVFLQGVCLQTRRRQETLNALTRATNFVAICFCASLISTSSHLLPKSIFFWLREICDGGGSRETFLKTLVKAYPREIKANKLQACALILSLCPFLAKILTCEDKYCLMHKKNKKRTPRQTDRLNFEYL